MDFFPTNSNFNSFSHPNIEIIENDNYQVERNLQFVAGIRNETCMNEVNSQRISVIQNRNFMNEVNSHCFPVTNGNFINEISFQYETQIGYDPANLNYEYVHTEINIQPPLFSEDNEIYPNAQYFSETKNEHLALEGSATNQNYNNNDKYIFFDENYLYEIVDMDTAELANYERFKNVNEYYLPFEDESIYMQRREIESTLNYQISIAPEILSSSDHQSTLSYQFPFTPEISNFNEIEEYSSINQNYNLSFEPNYAQIPYSVDQDFIRFEMQYLQNMSLGSGFTNFESEKAYGDHFAEPPNTFYLDHHNSFPVMEKPFDASYKNYSTDNEDYEHSIGTNEEYHYVFTEALETMSFSYSNDFSTREPKALYEYLHLNEHSQIMHTPFQENEKVLHIGQPSSHSSK